LSPVKTEAAALFPSMSRRRGDENLARRRRENAVAQSILKVLYGSLRGMKLVTCAVRTSAVSGEAYLSECTAAGAAFP
jgi:hypothetical protein